jgi:hypothetical protein
MGHQIENYPSGRIKWDFSGKAYYESGICAFDTIYVMHITGMTMWNGVQALYETGHVAWQENYAYYPNRQHAFVPASSGLSSGRPLFFKEDGRTVIDNIELIELPLGKGIRFECGSFGSRIFVFGQQVLTSYEINKGKHL